MLCGHLTLVYTMTVDKIVIFCNDVNKRSSSTLPVISNVDLGIKWTAGLKKPSWKSGIDIMPLYIHSSLMNCFNKVNFLHFYNELKFQILSGDEKMLGLSPGIRNLNFVQKSGHSTFVLSTIDMCMSVVLFVFCLGRISETAERICQKFLRGTLVCPGHFVSHFSGSCRRIPVREAESVVFLDWRCSHFAAIISY